MLSGRPTAHLQDRMEAMEDQSALTLHYIQKKDALAATRQQNQISIEDVMKDTQVFAESQSSDPVIREMARIVDLILSDKLLTHMERAELIRRLEIEYHAFNTWTKQYAGYFRSPRSSYAQDRRPSNTRQKKEVPMMNNAQLLLSIRIFPDFGGFTHLIDYPNDYWQHPEKYPKSEELVPLHLEAKLIDWEREFEMDAYKDYFQKIYGKMLWVSFDLQGIKIAKEIKKHVGTKARVIYQKPVECPYCRYDTSREVMESGELVTLNYRVGWHNLMVSGFED